MITILNEKRDSNEVFVLSDGVNKLAECEYSLDSAEILYAKAFIENDDTDLLFDSVIRAVLSRLDFAGKTDVISKNPDLRIILTKIGFKLVDGLLTINTTEFFKSTDCNKSDMS